MMAKHATKSVATVAKAVEAPQPIAAQVIEPEATTAHATTTPTKIHLTIAEKQTVVSPGGIVSLYPSQWIQDAGLISIAVASKIEFEDVSSVKPTAVTFLRDQRFICGIGSAQVRASQFTRDAWLINAALDGATSFLVNESDAA